MTGDRTEYENWVTRGDERKRETVRETSLVIQARAADLARRMMEDGWQLEERVDMDGLPFYIIGLLNRAAEEEL